MALTLSQGWPGTFDGKKTTPTQLLLLYPFIMSGGPVMHSICNNDLVFHEALTWGETIGVPLPELPMCRCYCPLNMILLSHEWCFLWRKAWVNPTTTSWERDITLAICGVWQISGGASWCSDTQRQWITSKIYSFQVDGVRAYIHPCRNKRETP